MPALLMPRQWSAGCIFLWTLFGAAFTYSLASLDPIYIRLAVFGALSNSLLLWLWLMQCPRLRLSASFDSATSHLGVKRNPIFLFIKAEIQLNRMSFFWFLLSKQCVAFEDWLATEGIESSPTQPLELQSLLVTCSIDPFDQSYSRHREMPFMWMLAQISTWETESQKQRAIPFSALRPWD